MGFLANLYKVFLTEASNVTSKIQQGIIRGDIVVIMYKTEDSDPQKATMGDGRRIIIPFTYGTSKAGNKVVRAWQLEGRSRTPNGDGKDPLKRIAGWRFFRVDRIVSWDRSSRTIKDAFDTVLSASDMAKIQKYNKQDKGMSSVELASVFPEKMNRTAKANKNKNNLI